MIAIKELEQRFAILWHSVPNQPTRPSEGEMLVGDPRKSPSSTNRNSSSHFDLLIQHGDHLLTWELLRLPVEGETSSVLRLPDHRLIYLDYEGALSDNRGHVIGWERGTLFWKSAELPYEFQLFGPRLTAKLVLAPQKADEEVDRTNPTIATEDHDGSPLEVWTLTAEIWQLDVQSR